MLIYVNGEPARGCPRHPAERCGRRRARPTPRRGIAVAVDGSVVPRARLAETALTEGAKVEIVTAVQGG